MTEINIPNELIEKLNPKMKGAGYSSIEEYIKFILNQLVSSEESDEDNAYEPEQEENVKEMLKDLGYL